MTKKRDKATTSKIMSAIRSKDTRCELKLRSALFKLGFRFRVNVANLPGKPDIVLPKYKTVIFVHGCFWHGHKGKCFRPSRTRVDFWRNKIKGNQTRDKRAVTALKKLGWQVIVVWECQLRNSEFSTSEARKIQARLNE